MQARHRWPTSALALAALLAQAPALAQTPDAPPAAQPEQAPPQEKKKSPWIFDGNVGALGFKGFSDVSFAGSATLGYSTPRLGLIGNGSFSAYLLENSQKSIDYRRFEGQGEGWFLTKKESSDSSLRFELRASGGGINYSNTVKIPPSGSQRFLDEDIWLGRGTLFVGLWYDRRKEDENTLHFEMQAGGGFQYIFMDERLEATNTGNNGNLNQVDKEVLSLQAQGRLALRWRFLPGTLRFRAHARGYFFSLSENNLVNVNGKASFVSEDATRIELFSKAFLDVEALSFFGFTPGAYGGADYVSASSNSESLSTFVPSVGVGLFKEVD